MNVYTALAALYRDMTIQDLHALRAAFTLDREQIGADREFIDTRLDAIAAELKRRDHETDPH